MAPAEETGRQDNEAAADSAAASDMSGGESAVAVESAVAEPVPGPAEADESEDDESEDDESEDDESEDDESEDDESEDDESEGGDTEEDELEDEESEGAETKASAPAESAGNESPAEGAEGEAEDSDEAAADDEAEPEIELPLGNVIEALLFAAREPLKLAQLAKCVRKGTRLEVVREAVATLNQAYLDTGRSFEIVEVSGKFQFMSRPEYSPYLVKLLGRSKKPEESDRKLTPAALDTLSIVAYKQPIARAEIETIRGVGCGPVLRALLERGSVRIVGRKTDVVGQPLLYGTTEDFLNEFGLSSLEGLPMIRELRRITGATAELPLGGPADETAGPDEDADEAPPAESAAETAAEAEDPAAPPADA